MAWTVFVLGAVISWGMYGPILHKGQVQLGNPLRALLCVGIAYFLIAVLVPVITLSAQGGLNGFNTSGTFSAGLGGALGALGAVCIIWAFRAGGLPTYVMPLVFGGAPLVNVLFSMLHPPKVAPNPFLLCRVLFVAVGASMVLYLKPPSLRGGMRCHLCRHVPPHVISSPSHQRHTGCPDPEDTADHRRRRDGSRWVATPVEY